MPNTGDGNLYVSCIDIGQGDCTVIKCPNGFTLMIDCGAKPDLPVARQRRVKTEVKQLADKGHIDALVLTHTDGDHYNRVPAIFGFGPETFPKSKVFMPSLQLGAIYFGNEWANYTVDMFKTWWTKGPLWIPSVGGSAASINRFMVDVNRESKETKRYVEKVFEGSSYWDVDPEAGRGKRRRVVAPPPPPPPWHTTENPRTPLQLFDAAQTGGCDVYCLAANVKPANGLTTNPHGVNTLSVVTLLVFGTQRVLIAGDATTETEDFIDEMFDDAWLAADTLRVAHHGSTTSSDDVFIGKVSPNVAVISAGVNNTYHLPKREIVVKFALLNDGRAPDPGGVTEAIAPGHPIHFYLNDTSAVEHRPITQRLYHTGSNGTVTFRYDAAGRTRVEWDATTKTWRDAD